ncbi:MAG: hypothetical protein QM765_31820 [Myxococcales bacterium]
MLLPILLAMLAASPAAPADKVLLTPRVELKKGLPVLTVSAWNREAAPRWVCVDPACLTLEYEETRGVWKTWEPTPKPEAAKVLDASAFARLAPEESRDLFVLGAILPVPSAAVRCEYRATEPAIAAAAKLGLAPLVAGPLGPASSPTIVETRSQHEALNGVLRGDFNAYLHLRPGDASVLGLLELGFKGAEPRKQEEIVRAVIQTEVPEAGPVLLRMARETKGTQVRAEAVRGFLSIHPPDLVPELAKLASDPAVTGFEFPELLQSNLVRAIALSGAPSAGAELARLEKTLKYSAAFAETAPETSLAFALPVSRLRVGDSKALAPFVARLKRTRPEVLAQALRATPFAQSRELACALAPFLDDARPGMRIAPFREYAAPRTPEERKAIDEFEKNAYDRVQDEAAFALAQLVPAARGGLELSRYRKLSAEQLAAVKKGLAKACAK